MIFIIFQVFGFFIVALIVFFILIFFPVSCSAGVDRLGAIFVITG